MNYKITDFNKERQTVSLIVTWDDGETYEKTMMADLSSEESIRRDIENWLANYAPMREAEKTSFDPSELIDSKKNISSKQLESIRASIEEVA